MILAGGLATRMRPLTEQLPKSLIPVAGRPFLFHQLEWLRQQGVTNVILSIGHLGAQIRSALAGAGDLGVRIQFVDEGEELRGSGGALCLALREGLLPAAFFLLNGDSYLVLDLARVEAAWSDSGLPALMTVYRNEGRWDRSNVRFDEGAVYYDKHAPRETRAEMPWIDYGMSILTSDAVAEWCPADGKGDVADLLHGLSAKGLVAGYVATERFFEIGSPSGLQDLEHHLETKEHK
ncbi:MAG: NTP transferase domain-containing protein [Candidatus Dormibacteraeota bacterium]|nr:NTP transferase domain-containing protein [Candidatus Dormibacteraeota bacterium]